MEKEKIAGQCEHCGTSYELEVDLSKPVLCDHCLQETYNFDTVEGSLYAPDLIAITR